ncbi:MAG: GNAT family protein [Thermoflexales bacterium]
MSLSIVALTSAQLASLLADPAQLDGMPVADGAAPPECLLRVALEALRRPAPADLALFAFISASPAQVVGSAMLKRWSEAGRVEVGYGVAESARGKGVATAAVRLLIARAFADPGVGEVYAETAVANTASRRVVEKAGFQHVGQRDSEEDGRVDQWVIARQRFRIGTDD